MKLRDHHLPINASCCSSPVSVVLDHDSVGKGTPVAMHGRKKLSPGARSTFGGVVTMLGLAGRKEKYSVKSTRECEVYSLPTVTMTDAASKLTELLTLQTYDPLSERIVLLIDSVRS